MTAIAPVPRTTFLRLAGAAAAMVFLPLAFLAFIAFGLRECGDHCGPASDQWDALLLAAAYAALFGVVAGSAAAFLIRAVRDRLGRALAIAVTVGALAVGAYAAVSLAPRAYIYIQYLRTPRDQLPPGDPRRIPSDCAKHKLPPNVICAV